MKRINAMKSTKTIYVGAYDKNKSTNTTIATGEKPPGEYCPIINTACSLINCSKCKSLSSFTNDAVWVCVGCYDKYMNGMYSILPFHSVGKCHVCGYASVALILTEIKDET